MPVICIGGEKGGVGKSTVCTNIAVSLAEDGKDVLIVNTDVQDTVGAWAAVREEDHPERPKINTVSLLGNTVTKGIKDLVERYEIIIIDAAGHDSIEQRQAMVVSDILVVPMRPTSFDVWTLDKVSDLVNQVQALNPTMRAGVFMNQVPYVSLDRGRKDMEHLMESYPEIKLLSSSLTYRASYQNAAGEGLGVNEINRSDSRAKSEIHFLIEDILALNGGM
ncbi:MAG: AAA family ATPase [Gammaproteobacteria bacterium]|nr:AAA family ATPase [Gammaproteobacteria bacterium]